MAKWKRVYILHGKHKNKVKITYSLPKKEVKITYRLNYCCTLNKNLCF